MGKVSNPRFPHLCKVYRLVGETSFSPGEEQVLYEGVCNKYIGSNLRTFTEKNVIRTDYAIDIPGLVKGIRPGDMVWYSDYSGEGGGFLVSECYASEMGTTVYFNRAQN